MKVVVGTLHTGEQFIEELEDAFPDVEFVPAYADSEQPDAIVDADVFMGWPTREAFLAARQLKWIHCPGAGIDKLIAIPEIVASDLPITNAPGPHVNPMADHVIGMMVALTHKFREMARDQDKRFWGGADKYDHTFSEISGSTMGIYGLGPSAGLLPDARPGSTCEFSRWTRGQPPCRTWLASAGARNGSTIFVPSRTGW